MTEETVKCELCGELTAMTGTKRCDRCWEVERWVTANPEIAGKVLRNLESEPLLSERLDAHVMRHLHVPAGWQTTIKNLTNKGHAYHARV
jgi:hypothetical protein